MLLSLPASRSWDPPGLPWLDLFKRINRPSLTTGHPLLRHDWHPIEKDAGVFVLSCYLKTNRQCHLSHALWRQIYYHVHTLLLWIVKLISQCQHLPRFAFSPVGKLGNLWTLFSHFCPSLWEFLFYIESWHLAEVERGESRKDNYISFLGYWGWFYTKVGEWYGHFNLQITRRNIERPEGPLSFVTTQNQDTGTLYLAGIFIIQTYFKDWFKNWDYGEYGGTKLCPS